MTMTFPSLAESVRIARLQPPTGKIRIVLDTDTYNEIDDQFAVVHALLSPERLMVEAIYAAPFLNNRATSPADGMEKSYAEILRLLQRLNVSPRGSCFAVRRTIWRAHINPRPAQRLMIWWNGR